MKTEKNATLEEIEDDLTDEERALLDEDEGEGEGAGAAADELKDAVQEPAKPIAGDGEGEGDKAAAAEVETGKDDEGEGGDERPERLVRPDDAPLRAEAPKDAAERASALDAEEATLEQKFEDGDITSAEYRKGLRDLNDQRASLRWEQQKAELAGEMSAQAKANAWAREVENFMATTAAALTASRPMMVAFDEYVKEVTGDPKNAGLTDRQQLDKAHNAFLADMKKMGVDLGAPAPEPSAKEKALKTAAAAVKRELPPNIGKVPAAAIPDTDGGKFAAIDRITDPDAYEAAVAKLEASGEFEAYANSR